MIAPEMPSEPGITSTSRIDIVPVQEAFSLFTRRSPPTDRPRIQAKKPRDNHGSHRDDDRSHNRLTLAQAEVRIELNRRTPQGRGLRRSASAPGVPWPS